MSIHPMRVIFGDTDQMGVVYYGNYLRYFEAARAAYWRGLGKTFRDLEAFGVALPVVEAHCRYRRPAHYEDLLQIEVVVDEMRAASVRFSYAVRRDGELLAEGFTRHAAISATGRPRAMPPEFADLIPIEVISGTGATVL